MTARLVTLLRLLLLLSALHDAHAQITLPALKRVHQGCQPQDVEACRMNCAAHYHDPTRFLCPCYSKLGVCLVSIGCSMKQRVDVMAFCTRKGYCKDGYCTYRAGDLTPRVDTRHEVFALTSVDTPDTPCIDACCPGDATCSQNASMLTVRNPGREYRKDEVLIAPREGDPRLGVNQAYDRMPYSIPLANLP